MGGIVFAGAARRERGALVQLEESADNLPTLEPSIHFSVSNNKHTYIPCLDQAPQFNLSQNLLACSSRGAGG